MHEVGFDPDGDDFTAPDGNPFVFRAGLTLGCTEFGAIPELSDGVPVLLAVVGLKRRKRNYFILP